jgi:hypothetical protein
MPGRQGNDSLSANTQRGDKPWLVTTNTGASVVIARPDITVGLPKREMTQPYVLQMASGKTLPILKEALTELTLEQCSLTTWVFLAIIIDKLILGLDVLRTRDVSVDSGCNLQMGKVVLKGMTMFIPLHEG